MNIQSHEEKVLLLAGDSLHVINQVLTFGRGSHVADAIDKIRQQQLDNNVQTSHWIMSPKNRSMCILNNFKNVRNGGGGTLGSEGRARN